MTDSIEIYLKEGESTAQCVARNREDVGIALRQLAKVTGERDAALERAQQFRESFESLLADCVGRIKPELWNKHRAALSATPSPAPVENIVAEYLDYEGKPVYEIMDPEDRPASRDEAHVENSYAPVESERHSDGYAVDKFAAAMKSKLAQKRLQGRGGWEDPNVCTTHELWTMMVDHIPKGDAVDVGNFAMMVWNRQQSLIPAAVKLACDVVGALNGLPIAVDHEGAPVYALNPQTGPNGECPICGGIECKPGCRYGSEVL